jgi:hypothetical protein
MPKQMRWCDAEMAEVTLKSRKGDSVF